MATGSFPQRFGKYVLLRKLAVGGMAEVFLAKAVGAEGFQRTVVIKRILPSYTEDEAFVSMFIDEARIAAALHHANVIQVIDFDKVDDAYYIAMEYVEGRDLRKVLDRGRKTGKRMSPLLAAHVTSLIASGLHYAHTRRGETGEPLHIIHRDVSPHNILISFAGDVKLTDFGIAKAAARSTKTRAGTVKGKCAYMSPEQARGKPLDARSDIFALCSVLWEMLAYRRLFEGDSDFEILNNVLNQSVPPPSLFRPEVVRDLDAIVLKGLRRDLNERFPDMAALEKDLQDFVFKHASGPDDVDIGAYVRDLFSAELDEIPEYAKEPTPRGKEPVPAPAPPGAGTAVLPENLDGVVPRVRSEAETLEVDTAAKQPPTTVPVGMLKKELDEMLSRGGGTAPQVEETPAAPGGSPRPGAEEPPPTVALSAHEVQAAITGVRAVGEPGPEVGATGRLRVGTGSRSGVKTAGSSRAAMWVFFALLGVAVAIGGAYLAMTGGEPSPAPVTTRVEDAGTLRATAPDPGPAVVPDAGAMVAGAGTSDAGTRVGPPDGGPPPAAPVAEVEVVVRPVRASVLINGRPVRLAGGRVVMVGPHRVGDEVEVEATASGHVPFRERVRIQDAKQRIEVALARKKGVEPARAVSETGFVSINARPWADVYYRGRKIGTTPVSRFEVPVGRQTFVLRNRTTTREVTLTVEKGQTATRVVEM